MSQPRAITFTITILQPHVPVTQPSSSPNPSSAAPHASIESTGVSQNSGTPLTGLQRELGTLKWAVKSSFDTIKKLEREHKELKELEEDKHGRARNTRLAMILLLIAGICAHSLGLWILIALVFMGKIIME
jgi:hypothetical protein